MVIDGAATVVQGMGVRSQEKTSGQETTIFQNLQPWTPTLSGSMPGWLRPFQFALNHGTESGDFHETIPDS
jgi:hypothetical protein